MTTSLPVIQDLGQQLFMRRIAQLDLLEKFLEDMVFYTDAAKGIFRSIKDTAILKQREFLALHKGHSSAGL